MGLRTPKHPNAKSAWLLVTGESQPLVASKNACNKMQISANPGLHNALDVPGAREKSPLVFTGGLVEDVVLAVDVEDTVLERALPVEG